MKPALFIPLQRAIIEARWSLPGLVPFALPISFSVLQLFQPWTFQRDRLANILKRDGCAKNSGANQRTLEQRIPLQEPSNKPAVIANSWKPCTFFCTLHQIVSIWSPNRQQSPTSLGYLHRKCKFCSLWLSESAPAEFPEGAQEARPISQRRSELEQPPPVTPARRVSTHTAALTGTRVERRHCPRRAVTLGTARIEISAFQRNPFFIQRDRYKLEWAERGPWLTVLQVWEEELCWQQMAAHQPRDAPVAAPASRIYHPGFIIPDWCRTNSERFQMGRGGSVPAELSSCLVNV